MSRISRDQMLFELAQVAARRSTCSRLGVGAVLSRSGRVISLGYNGTPSGTPHCNHTQEDTKCEDAVHAEANAIAFAAKYGVSTIDSELHVTHMPCLKCAQLIINCGIVRVNYLLPYRLPSGILLLKMRGIEVNGP